MVFLVGLQGDELLWSQSFLLELFDLRQKDYFRILGGVDARGLKSNHEDAAVLQKMLAIHSDDSSLVWLGDISKHKVDHLNHESVELWFSGILNNGHNVGSFLGHGNQVSSASGRKLNSIKNSLFTNYVGHMRAGSS